MAEGKRGFGRVIRSLVAGVACALGLVGCSRAIKIDFDIERQTMLTLSHRSCRLVNGRIYALAPQCRQALC